MSEAARWDARNLQGSTDGCRAMLERVERERREANRRVRCSGLVVLAFLLTWLLIR